ncbi:unnamed protein product, partial [Mesorhabditis belari]|uniref:Uncharacterized protein n=1 Tax=Mesorhabditis belari TaxID=2138241 RepID=A0AAF3EVK1_9BILA
MKYGLATTSYEGPLEELPCKDDLGASPLGEHAAVYHQGSRRSIKEGEEPYPIVSEPYEGPLDYVDRENDLERLPFETEPATDKTKVKDKVASPTTPEVEEPKQSCLSQRERANFGES